MMDLTKNQDKLKEECGVFGMLRTDGKNVARSIYYGLCALQHRGQESAGIAVCNTNGPAGNIGSHKGMGLVSEVFAPDTLKSLQGDIGIGHVRYSTTGASNLENAQPFIINYIKGTLGLVHNGNLRNMGELRSSLEKAGIGFHSTSDSDVIACQIARTRTKTTCIEDAVFHTAKMLKGGFALIVMSPRKLIGVRDPLGLKPLCLGRQNGHYILASESCAFSSVNAEFVRDIFPGEIVTITKNGIDSNRTLCHDMHAHCIFEYIYFARPDSTMDGVNVYDARVRAGKALALALPAQADIVTGVPDSGLAAAMGYSQQAGIPFEFVFQKNNYIGRTFIKPTLEERECAARLKLGVLESTVRKKRLVLIDDSIVRGTTIANLIKMLKKAGAAKVHVRISSPPFLYPCYYGTDVPSSRELIAHSHTPEEICRQIGADSLGYLPIRDFPKMTGKLPLCQACFDGHYPVL